LIGCQLAAAGKEIFILAARAAKHSQAINPQAWPILAVAALWPASCGLDDDCRGDADCRYAQ